MKNELKIALSKAKIEGAEKLTVGTHSVNGLVRVVGEITVAEDQMIAATASIMSVEFLLLTLYRAGVTRESAMQVITDVASEYLTDWTGSEADKKAAKKARKAAVAEFDPEGKGSAVFEEFKARLPKVPRAGAVKFEGTVEEVQIQGIELVEVESA